MCWERNEQKGKGRGQGLSPDTCGWWQGRSMDISLMGHSPKGQATQKETTPNSLVILGLQGAGHLVLWPGGPELPWG